MNNTILSQICSLNLRSGLWTGQCMTSLLSTSRNLLVFHAAWGGALLCQTALAQGIKFDVYVILLVNRAIHLQREKRHTVRQVSFNPMRSWILREIPFLFMIWRRVQSALGVGILNRPLSSSASLTNTVWDFGDALLHIVAFLLLDVSVWVSPWLDNQTISSRISGHVLSGMIAFVLRLQLIHSNSTQLNVIGTIAIHCLCCTWRNQNSDEKC